VYVNSIGNMSSPPSFEEWQRVQREAALAWDEPLNAYDVEPPADGQTWIISYGTMQVGEFTL
jgi:hypothetical protein